MSGTSKERRKRTTLPPAPPPSVARSYKPKCRGKPFIRGFTVPHRVEVLHNSGLLLSTLTTPPPPPALMELVGGRLDYFTDKWEEITDDTYVLSVIRKGYIIPILTPPDLSNKPILFPVSQSGIT